MASLKRQALKAIRVGVPVVLARACTSCSQLINLQKMSKEERDKLLQEHLSKIQENSNVNSVGPNTEG